ncbi:MAG: SDR family NAD(P)-dependent oxidoreductase [Candidatus Berkelbacteria bacterium]|nr:SDR family NAD(P)-dependent oxidoreductase [Candidatus Berkelbacteria bacterium]
MNDSNQPTANGQRRKILVTGGAGFIGSNLVDALIEQNHDVVVVDNLSTGLRANVNKKAKFYEVDITSKSALEDVFEKEKPEAVYHLAAQASVRNSADNPQNDVKVNVIGTINLLECAVKNDVKKFIFSSTGGAIYGDNVERPTTEDANEDPVSPYGLDKLAGEKFIRYFERNSSIKATCLRYANVYGPRQNPKGEAGVVAIFASQMLKNEPVQINGTGEQTRDFVFVKDVCAANLNALNSSVTGTFNIGMGKEISINELAQKMLDVSSSKSPVEHVEAKQGEQMYSALSAEKARLELGFEPQYSLSDGLQKTIEWFRK